MNRYHDAIIALTEILKLREELNARIVTVSKSLTVSEFQNRGGLDVDLLEKCFVGLHVKGAPYFIEAASHVKSQFVVDDNCRLNLHVKPAEGPGAILPALLKEAALKY